MGLLDVLNGMQNGPRGQRDPSTSSAGMSPITMAILGLLAFKAVKSLTGGQPSTSPSSPGAARGGTISAGVPGASGALGDLLSGSLGSLFAGGAAGSVLSGGLKDLVSQFQQSGHSDSANSWVGTGPNKAISPNDLASALGADKINTLMTQSGMSRDELLQGLSQYLPEVINQLTPEGRLPTDQEAARLL
jgi:uncharacterized protein YidB (DUF937 family)